MCTRFSELVSLFITSAVEMYGCCTNQYAAIRTLGISTSGKGGGGVSLVVFITCKASTASIPAQIKRELNLGTWLVNQSTL